MKSVESDGVWTIYATSSDGKPTREQINKLYSGQQVILLEMDTGDVYMYDYVGDRWYKQ